MPTKKELLQEIKDIRENNVLVSTDNIAAVMRSLEKQLSRDTRMWNELEEEHYFDKIGETRQAFEELEAQILKFKETQKIIKAVK